MPPGGTVRAPTGHTSDFLMDIAAEIVGRSVPPRPRNFSDEFGFAICE